MERIPVTHAGSLIRPQELLGYLSAVDHGRAAAEGADYQAALRRAVGYVVRRQLEAGVDIIDDGEMGKSTWITYLYERTTGLTERQLEGSFSRILPASRDRQNFPGAYAELDAVEHDATTRIRTEAAGGDAELEQPVSGGAAAWACTGPMTYDRTAIDRDLANFKAALAETGTGISRTFLPVVAPASAYWLLNEYYKTDEEFVYALADVLHEEYQAIVDSGAFLQVDDAVLMHEADTMLSRGQSWEDYRRWAQLRVDALNHALRGLPEDRIRYHVCFGSWHGPHAYDPPLRDSIDLVLQVNAKYYLMEQANPRHEHEWKIWEDVPLPEGKVLVPGVVTHHTNVVEHPELVAQRLVRLANVVGRDRVMGGTDCGFAQGSFMHRVHEEIQWAKLASLAEGAKIASRELWGAKAEVLSAVSTDVPRGTSGVQQKYPRSTQEEKLRRYRRAGFAGVVALAATAMAAAGCSSSSSSSSSPASTSAAPAASSPSAASTAAGTGGQGAQSVTNYVDYTDGKAGAADNSLPPVYIGYVNQQGGPTAVGLLATAGAQMAVKYANAELGGVDGHPIKLVTCFIASAEEEGTVCAQKFLANKNINVIEMGGVAVGVQSFYSTLGGAKPVIDGVAATPIDAVQKNAVILFGDATHILPPFGTYAKDVLHAKTAALVYPSDNAGIATGAAAIKQGLQAAGVNVKAVGYPESQTDLTSVLTAAGAQTADMVIPYSDTAGCVNLGKSLKTLGITDTKKIVSAPLCLNGQVIKGLGDWPHWTYAIASSLFGDPSDPGMATYMKVAAKYSTPEDAPDPWNIVNFGQTLTTIRLMNEVGYANLSPSAILAKAKEFTGPQALGAPALDCGKYSDAPAVCNDRIQLFEYTGGVTSGKPNWVKASGWTQPPS